MREACIKHLSARWVDVDRAELPTLAPSSIGLGIQLQRRLSCQSAAHMESSICSVVPSMISRPFVALLTMAASNSPIKRLMTLPTEAAAANLKLGSDQRL